MWCFVGKVKSLYNYGMNKTLPKKIPERGYARDITHVPAIRNGRQGIYLYIFTFSLRGFFRICGTHTGARAGSFHPRSVPRCRREASEMVEPRQKWFGKRSGSMERKENTAGRSKIEKPHPKSKANSTETLICSTSTERLNSPVSNQAICIPNVVRAIQRT